MKRILLVGLLIASTNCFAQEVPKVDISDSMNPIHSSSAADYIDKYAGRSSTGIIFNIIGTGVVIAGFAINPKTVGQYNTKRWVLVAGGGLNLIGFIIQASATNSMNNAAYRLRQKKIGMIINENGIGLQLAIN